MRNDLIILTFEGEGEILLAPTILSNVARNMASALSILGSHVREGQLTKIDVFIHSAEQGSLTVRLRAVMDTVRSAIPSRDAVGYAADVSTVCQTAAAGVVAVGVAMGLMAAGDGEEVRAPKELEIVVSQKASQNLKKSMEGWVSSAFESGVSKITISVPENPKCELVSEKWIDKKLFGSESSAPQMKGGEVAGSVELRGNPVIVNIKRDGVEQRVELFPGIASVKGHGVTGIAGGIPVLVEWRSKRVVPFEQGMVRIKGEISDLKAARALFTPLDPVSAEARKAVGYLIVNAQVVEE